MQNLPPHRLSAVEKVQKLQENFMLSFSPPLPCITRDCLNTATVGHVRWDGEAWVLIPQCKECTLKLARLYGILPTEE
jgi:hypothetical protein